MNEETDISNVLEPERLELLRLCFWINGSKQIIRDKKSFEIKFIEVRNSLGFQDETEFKEQLYRNLRLNLNLAGKEQLPLNMFKI